MLKKSRDAIIINITVSNSCKEDKIFFGIVVAIDNVFLILIIMTCIITIIH